MFLFYLLKITLTLTALIWYCEDHYCSQLSVSSILSL